MAACSTGSASSKQRCREAKKGSESIFLKRKLTLTSFFSPLNQLTPAVRALSIASRLNDRPFAIQILTLYVATVPLLVATFHVACMLGIKAVRSRNMQFAKSKEKCTPLGRLKFAAVGIVLLLAAALSPLMLFAYEPLADSIRWQERLFFSSTASSAIALLISWVVFRFLRSPSESGAFFLLLPQTADY